MLGALQAVGYYAMLRSSAPLNFHISGLLLVWAGYLWSMALLPRGLDRFSWWVVWFFAVVFRLQLGTAPPYLADDFERYLLDGRFLLAGINPYNALPLSHPELGGPDVPWCWRRVMPRGVPQRERQKQGTLLLVDDESHVLSGIQG